MTETAAIKNAALTPNDVREDAVRWNLGLSDRFDVFNEHLQASQLEYDWASKWIGVPLKRVFKVHMHIPSVHVGSFFTGLEEATSTHKQNDVRNITRDGKEEPPIYEVIELKSDLSRDFLVDGIAFMEVPGGMRYVLKRKPDWGGVQITLYIALSERDKGDEILCTAWRIATEKNFLKGEAFSLSGKFIKKSGETWSDVFLSEANQKPLDRLVQSINEQGKDLKNRGFVMMGPPGCLHADTPIYDPVDGSMLTVAEREVRGEPFHVYAMDENRNVVLAKAEAPWKYEPAEMVRLTFESGREITVTKGHRFLAGGGSTPGQDGLRFVSAEQFALGDFDVALPSIALDGEWPQSSAADQPCSILERSHSAPLSGAQHSTGKAPGSKDHCSLDFCPDGEQLLLEVSGDQEFLPSPGDALRRSHGMSPADDLEDSDTNIDPSERGLPSSTDCQGRIAARPAFYAERQLRRQRVEHASYSSALCARSPEANLRADTDQCTSLCVLESTETHDQAFSSLGTMYVNGRSHSIVMDRLVKAEFAGIAPYYDFHVPVYENYWAEGFFHHNTGKTLSARVIRNEAKATFIWISARDFYRMGAFGGLSFGFDLAKMLAPSILMLEDVDNWFSESTIDYLKTEMDGFAQSSGVVTLLTTNFPERLPEALLDRPGRFHEVLKFALPDADIRRIMLAKWLPSGMSEEVFAWVVENTEGYSGAHLKELANFAILISKENEALGMDGAAKAAVEKIKSQRDLIASEKKSKFAAQKWDAPAGITFSMTQSYDEAAVNLAWESVDPDDNPRITVKQAAPAAELPTESLADDTDDDSDWPEEEVEMLEGEALAGSLGKHGVPHINGMPIFTARDTVVMRDSIDPKRMTADFTIVTRGTKLNRYGTAVQIAQDEKFAGLKTHNYETNPIVLFGHGMQGLPFGGAIGTARDRDTGQVVLRKFKSKAISRVHFSQHLPDAATIFAATEEGIFSASSIQFRPHKARKLSVNRGMLDRIDMSDEADVLDLQMMSAAGLDFLESDLLEWSIVDIPADPGAIRRALDRGHINGEKVSDPMRHVFQSMVGRPPVWAPGFSLLGVAFSGKNLENHEVSAPILQTSHVDTLKTEPETVQPRLNLAAVTEALKQQSPPKKARLRPDQLSDAVKLATQSALQTALAPLEQRQEQQQQKLTKVLGG